MKRIGQMREIYRHPVKSFQGEKVSQSKVQSHGLLGDRSHVFINHSRADRHLSAKKIPYLLAYSASYVGDIRTFDHPEVQITSPQGETYRWDEYLLQHMRERFQLDLSLQMYPMSYDGLTAVDEANLLLVTDASLAALSELSGENLDVRRFRPNIVVELDEYQPFEEFNWMGRMLHIGDVKIEVYQPCQRCLMIGVDPNNANMDISILRNVAQQLDANFGVYASIKQTGVIQDGMPIYIE